RGKIKLANIQDNTSAHVEVVVNFQRGVDLERAKAALYAFTDCEVSLAANGMVIRDGQPVNLSVSEMLEANTEHMVELLRRDLEIQLNNLEEEWHRKSLVQIFIENRIYLRLEECKTWEAVIAAVDEGLRPHVGKLRRPVTQEDLVYLTEVKMRRISAWDAERARKELAKVDALIRQVKRDLADIVGTTVRYIDSLIERYGAGRERRTRIVSFDSVEAAAVAERTRKLYVEPKAGFIGTDLREAQEVGPCSDLDDVLVVFRDGNLVVVRVTDKKYVGENIVYTEVLDPTDREAVYNVIYTDEDSGKTYAKRFTLGGYTRERNYPLGAGRRRRVLFFARGESGVCAHLRLRKKPRVKPDRYVRFDELRVKGRSAAGNVVTRHAVSSARSLTEATVARRLAETSSESESPDPEQTPSGGSSLRQSTLF
ncbi:MAG TPA: DNA gyrase subunit A, partial [Acidobacteriota bacterium]|nr:DNA gyrase subunit A [Acidobacteriota bacterium]